MKYVIFDFDGTIADSMPLVADIARIILPKTDLSPTQIEKLRNMPPRQ
ncbi:HAD hydrolase-like protein, partial [Candidatus Saccharibacteria bacterium]|nr:HAD hydrolase-like protein [Candidatus Saccharibacteria bacterium]